MANLSPRHCDGSRGGAAPPLRHKQRRPRRRAQAQPQTQQPQQHKPPNWRCFVRDAMVFYDRVHVRCYNKTAEGVTFFAVDTSQPIAVSLVTKALIAMQQGRR